jgi:hypothetical protein
MQAYGGDRGRRIASSSAARRHKAHCETGSKHEKEVPLNSKPLE